MPKLPQVRKATLTKPFPARNDRASQLYGEPIIRMFWNENHLGMSPKAKAAMEKAMERGHFYHDFSSTALKERLAKEYRLSQDNVYTAAGSSAIIWDIGTVYLDPGDEVVYCDPTFGDFWDMIVFNGAVPVKVPVTEKEQKFDLDGILAALTEKTKIIVICNPNNPTGTALTHKEIEEFAAKVPEEILIVIDEAYMDYASDPDVRTAIDLVDRYNILVLRTFSKMYGMAGIRTGYAIAKADIIDNFMRCAGGYNTSAIAMAGAIAALDDTEHRDRVYAMVKSERERLAKELRRLGCTVWDSQASFVYFDCGIDPEELFTLMMSRNLRMGAFPHSRISVATPELNDLFLQYLAEFMAARKSGS
ncbi:MAG: aminotransferase class I/II-fold pyridoxal phosphate-dependent enzyme [Oscillospiraceae bacterium]|nr:aminotransferase class I/II-fold pyridoxal phosphate-dependent enzyme [Oscillospiraceae bacterium]